MKTKLKTTSARALIFVALILAADAALATTFGIPGQSPTGFNATQLGGGDMPWEGPLVQIRNALTGGAAKALAVIAMAVAGGMLAFGGELSEFAKRICMVVIAAATMIFAGGIMSAAGLA